jgi:hypothetical protein
MGTPVQSRKYRPAALGILLNFASFCAQAGVTIITHGLNGNVDGWITGMANRIPTYPGYIGTNFSCYQISFTPSGGGYLLTSARTAGSAANTPESGEIIIKLDWRQLADGNSYNTFQIASAVVPALLNTNFISEFGGHAIAEYPLHLIGHSRGGSLVCELSRLLGTNGVWVDHVTTLDPHPLNDPAFPFDAWFYNAVDAPANTYVNVLFHDNLWQTNSYPISGLAVDGAYVRKLTSFGGGYGSSHSDVHLWYHGTLDFRVPASDTEASITSSERSSWWTTYESRGTNAGFYYSLISHGDRTSTAQPAGAGLGMVRDGFNQNWDLGAGVSANRTALPSNNGEWPNLLKINRTTTNQVFQGQTMPLQFYYQWAKANSNLATISIYLDKDFNPLNTNQTLLREISVPANGASFVSFVTTNLTLHASNASPGFHAVLGRITGGGKTRFLYAPEWVEVLASRQPPTLEISRLNPAQYRISVFGLLGQTVVIQSSTNLQSWTSVVTNTLLEQRWEYTNSPSLDSAVQYYRGVLP